MSGMIDCFQKEGDGVEECLAERLTKFCGDAGDEDAIIKCLDNRNLGFKCADCESIKPKCAVFAVGEDGKPTKECDERVDDGGNYELCRMLAVMNPDEPKDSCDDEDFKGPAYFDGSESAADAGKETGGSDADAPAPAMRQSVVKMTRDAKLSVL